MQALVKYDYRDGAVEIREIPEPSLGPDQVLIKVKAVGVCGSDIHMWRERQSWAVKLPLVLGHEFSGLVVEVGERVTGFAPGDRITCETAGQTCGKCEYCLSGAYNLCPHRLGFGALLDGACSHYVAARSQILHRLPKGTSFEHGALTEPLCVAYNALVEKTEIRPGDLVVIQGPGPIGCMALQIARLRGAGATVVLGKGADDLRLAGARKLGADYIMDIGQEDPLSLVRSLTDGYGADLVVDCTGDSQALKQALELVRPNGRITKIGWGPEPLDFSLDPLVAKAVTLQGSFSHTYRTWERAIGLIASGQVNLEPVIGGVYSLSEWQAGFTAMDERTNIKSILLTDC